MEKPTCQFRSSQRKLLRSLSLILPLLVLLALVFFKIATSQGDFIGTSADEVVYTEPAVNYERTGVYGATGIARQLELKGCHGLDQHDFLVAPLAGYLRAACYQASGLGFTERRLADGLFFIFTVGAFAWVASAFCGLEAALSVACIFSLNSSVFWIPGRPDTIALGFGLAAFGVAVRAVKSGDAAFGHKIWRTVCCGVLIGLAGLAHPFAGVFWGTTCLLFLLFSGKIDAVKFLQLGAALALGGALAALLWLPQIICNWKLWHEQFFYMVAFKNHLNKSFLVSARYMFYDLRLFHVMSVVLAISLLLMWRNRFFRVSRNILVVGMALLAVWRCHSFELYNGIYIIYFWGVFCLLFAMAVEETTSALGRIAGKDVFGWLKFVVFFVAFCEGVCISYNGLIQSSHYTAPVVATTIAKLNQTVATNEKVLVCAACYMDLEARDKTLWYWAENLDVKGFDVIVARQLRPSVQADADQFGDVLTPDQARDFDQQFELVARLPAPGVRFPILPERLLPQSQEIFVFRKKVGK